jgi:hypothetical protein
MDARSLAHTAGCATLGLVLAGCSTAALDEPIHFAIACRTDTALSMARRTAGGEGIVDPLLGQIAELAILKDAERTTAYARARDAMVAEHDSLDAIQLDEAVDTKVEEMREARSRATGQAAC